MCLTKLIYFLFHTNYRYSTNTEILKYSFGQDRFVISALLYLIDAFYITPSRNLFIQFYKITRLSFISSQSALISTSKKQSAPVSTGQKQLAPVWNSQLYSALVSTSRKQSTPVITTQKQTARVRNSQNTSARVSTSQKQSAPVSTSQH